MHANDSNTQKLFINKSLIPSVSWHQKQTTFFDSALVTGRPKPLTLTTNQFKYL
jgi:hypothetical protein